MRKVLQLQTTEQLKTLSDPRRLAILRLLMAAPSTLTRLARATGQSPAWIRHHLLALERVGLVELDEIRTTKKVTEKFYRSVSAAILIQEIILPRSRKPAVIFSGSHDLCLETAAETLSKRMELISLTVGSLNGLINLRQEICQVCGAHLLDENGEYNLGYVRRIFPDRAMELFTLAYRTQGLMFLRGNLRRPTNISDLAKTRMRFINRNPGSATRIWLDTELSKKKIEPKNIPGYERSVTTHSEAAAWVRSGKADVALGLQAAAHMHGLDFTPLFEERFDLILPRDQERILLPLLEHLQTKEFRQAAEKLSGYTTQHSGEQIQI